MLQKALDKHLGSLLPDVPRRSVLMVDSSKQGPDGGCGAIISTDTLLAPALHAVRRIMRALRSC
jgi:hypothetical protein